MQNEAAKSALNKQVRRSSVVLFVFFIFYIVWYFDTLKTFRTGERLPLPRLASSD